MHLSATSGNTLKAFVYSALLLLISSCFKREQTTVITSPVPGVQHLTFLHDSTVRQYILYTPENLSDYAPVVFVLHGHGRTAKDIMPDYDMNTLADREGFAICYPQGEKDNAELPHWNARLTISNTDDIGFLSRLAKHLQQLYHFDPQRTFVCGMSNGGFMSHTLACERPDVFKAAASIAGSMSGFTWSHCNSNIPTPFMQVHGTADKRIPIDGSLSTEGGWGGAPAIDEVVNFIAAKNGCTSLDSTFIPPNTHLYYHNNQMNGSDVWYYKIDNWGHGWPKITSAKTPNQTINPGINATEEVWKFFSRY